MTQTFSPLPITAHGVSMICRDENRFLLVKRGKEPLKGSLAFPGGGVEAGETAEQAAHRELLEETNLRCSGLKLVETIDLSKEGLYGRVYNLSIYRAYDISGIAQAGDDAVSLHWLTIEDMLNHVVTASTLAFARRIMLEEI
ncbi:NUDIX hydrolase [Pseudochrobactrum sp. MP213Fo]|uniref:NUDIX hydrolase n=1 Tax=Pseudochrobactrum sp. MP213Fo TaxID=3022250 RepID=UPI003B9E76EB